jgi:hypothetical protein
MPPIERTKSSFELDQVLLESERLPKSVDLKRVVTDLDIFEHLDKPYLTAEMSIADQTNLYETAGIIGGERITITITSAKDDVSVPITNHFYVTKAKVIYANDDSQLVIFSLIEDIAFISNLYNVNRHYSGKCGNIIEKIAKQYFKEQLSSDEPLSQLKNENQNLHLIVPNMDPLEAMQWVRNRATTVEGFPFYLHSSLTKDSLFFRDLGTLLTQPVINPIERFRIDKASLDSPSNKMIINHKFESFQNIVTMIAKGLIGSSYRYIDTTQETSRTFSFDVRRDLYDVLIEKGFMAGQENPEFSTLYKVNEKSFNEYRSRDITRIGGSNSQRNFFWNDDQEHTWDNGYSESKTAAGYKQVVISCVMDDIIKRAPFTMIVDGINFIDGDKHSTIGNNIAVEFPKATADRDTGSNQIDTRRSGNYLIFACRHMFKKEKYEVSLSCVKMGDLRQND